MNLLAILFINSFYYNIYKYTEDYQPHYYGSQADIVNCFGPTTTITYI